MRSWTDFIILVAATVPACGHASGESQTIVDRTAAQVEVSKAILTAARAAASDYGRDHLGHYVKLEMHHLVGASVEVPDELSMDLWASHTGFCITVTNRALPSIHPWRVGTAGHSHEITSADRCRK
jgi:hypothetical protein